MKGLLVLTVLLAACASKSREPVDRRWREQAERITITRDQWGIPHVYGKTDADAVFGAMYVQCEESFERVERNYIEKLGRLSEVEGPQYLLQDLNMRLLYDSARAVADYNNSPPWLKNLLAAFTDGIHFFLHTHPDVKPALLHEFKPWYPLLFTDGAFIAAKTGGITLEDMRNLYGSDLPAASLPEKQAPTGSNGFAIAPSRTANGYPLLYINPHVTFYFRTEMHMVSEEGLNAYGAVTWGQFFVFQGFNEHCGWMHTSSAVDAADVYSIDATRDANQYQYRYRDSLKPVVQKPMTFRYKKADGFDSRQVMTFATHHGPVMGMRNGKWLSLRSGNQSLDGLIQSWQRMKAKNLQEFTKVLELRSNASTNTLYADKANIAYWHGNFIPKRANGLNTFAPLDGSQPVVEWQGIHELNELVHYINPLSGFLQNCNSTPYTAAGGPTSKTHPDYMAPEGENFRSAYAIRQLASGRKWTTASLAALGYDTYLPLFDTLLPPLLKELERSGSELSLPLREAGDSLRKWNRKSATASIATTVAVFWAYAMLSQQKTGVPRDADDITMTSWIAHHTSGPDMLRMLSDVLAGLQNLYGSWKIPWGEINRFQRLNGEYNMTFDNKANSFPSPLASAALGCLPSFETVWHEQKQYGVAGNSFVAVVEFGPKVKAYSIATGGQSFDPASKHFTNQAERFLLGQLKEVPFYREDVEKRAEKKFQLSSLLSK